MPAAYLHGFAVDATDTLDSSRRLRRRIATRPAQPTRPVAFTRILGGPDKTARVVTVARTYWANQATGLVNDVPGEIMLHPGLWGTVRFAD